MAKPPKETEWERRKRRDRERAEHVAKHGPGCQICGAVPKSGGLHQDHDHRTGRTRGWLCHRCNRGLPTWVNEEWLYAAATYLRYARHDDWIATMRERKAELGRSETP